VTPRQRIFAIAKNWVDFKCDSIRNATIVNSSTFVRSSISSCSLFSALLSSSFLPSFTLIFFHSNSRNFPFDVYSSSTARELTRAERECASFMHRNPLLSLHTTRHSANRDLRPEHIPGVITFATLRATFLERRRMRGMRFCAVCTIANWKRI
jgi:hypothetical protein